MAQWVRDYVREARDCREAARKAATPQQRDHLLYMAGRGKEITRERAAYTRLEGVLSAVLKEDTGNQDEGSATPFAP